MSKAITHFVRRTTLSLLGATLLLASFNGPTFAQTVPSANLQQLTFIGIPNWITSAAVGPTANVASYDMPAFNRVTGVMYLADRPNHGATAIDAKTLTYLGTVVPPGCATDATCSPSGVLVVPDLQKLIITTRNPNIFIYDLRAPGQSPVILNLPGAASDELDYDPLNQRVYIGSTVSPFGLIVLDAAKNTILGKIPFADSVEQPRFNPNDGLIYANSPTSVGQLLVEVDPQQGPFGAIINGLPLPAGCANAVDIDPVSNTAILGCAGPPNVEAIIDLKTGAILGTFPLGSADIGFFDPHNRRWYVGTRNPGATNVNCPVDSTGMFPALAVFSNSPTAAQLAGVACTGRGARVAGVDPILNNIYVPVLQYPPDPNSADTGRPGVLVFHDPAATFTGTPAGTQEGRTQAVLTAVGGSGVTGTIDMSLRRRNMDVEASLNGLPAGSTTVRLAITTSVGNEVIPCGVDATGKGFCAGDLAGDPMIGGVVGVGSAGIRVASGPITLTSSFPSFIPLD